MWYIHAHIRTCVWPKSLRSLNLHVYVARIHHSTYACIYVCMQKRTHACKHACKHIKEFLCIDKITYTRCAKDNFLSRRNGYQICLYTSYNLRTQHNAQAKFGNRLSSKLFLWYVGMMLQLSKIHRKKAEHAFYVQGSKQKLSWETKINIGNFLCVDGA